jgi:hypothetical protein
VSGPCDYSGLTEGEKRPFPATLQIKEQGYDRTNQKA